MAGFLFVLLLFVGLPLLLGYICIKIVDAFAGTSENHKYIDRSTTHNHYNITQQNLTIDNDKASRTIED
ncbi:MAG TPA: hypothetical protein VFM69_07590 [Pricia sp.]|nr:hypothetical protein [Pricia sp.]